MGIYDGVGPMLRFDKINADRKDLWLWIGPEWVKYLLMALFISFIVSLINCIGITVNYLNEPLTNPFFNDSFFSFVIAWCSLLLIWTSLSINLCINYKKIDCLYVSTSKRRIGKKYNWDTFIKDYNAQNEADRVKHFSEMAEWLREQEFEGDVELIMAVMYTFGSIMLNPIRLRFTNESDLILTKTVW